MKKLFFLITISFSLFSNAQNYLLTFAGTGASSSVDNITVENLTAGTSLTLNGNDILHLTNIITGINPIETDRSGGMKIYPNPTIDNSIIKIFPPIEGDATISVYNITGKLVTQVQSYLDHDWQEFKLSGTENGLLLITVKGTDYQFTGKLLCNEKSNGTMNIEKVSNNVQTVDGNMSKMEHKGVQVTIDMQYTAGDRLKLTGISSKYTTIITDIPTTSKLVTFTFIECTDGDGNNYPVIQIGTGKSAPQIWMAENLKATKFKNGTTPIPNITGNAAWQALSTPAFSWYNNEAGNKATYGALYNWYTVNTGNLCPTGWHVPTDAEWTTLTDFLGGLAKAGGKLKETGTLHWINPNTGATNETGFTALPGGYRESDGKFYVLGCISKMWSFSAYNSTFARCRFIHYDKSEMNSDFLNKKAGLSVRCVKD
jgi:uncharacterized protein (TIGR02145 family)